jgi:SAM-dependent methyltransferase
LHLQALSELAAMADPIVPFAVRTAARFGLADLLDEPTEHEELADRLDLCAPALLRLLRCLAGRGIFEEVAPGRFVNSRLSTLLRSDHPLSLRDSLPLLPADADAWAESDYSLRTGRSAFEHVHGVPYYTWLTSHPEEHERVDRSVEALNPMLVRTLAGAWPWADAGRILDVGSGLGGFTLGLLRRFPGISAVLLDIGPVAGRARENVARRDLTDRCEVVVGDYFEAVPGGCDTYLLKSILHDWDDVRALRLLDRVREAIDPRARLLVIEAILQPDNRFDLGKLMDLHSLVMAGGVDRSLDELSDLLARASFEVVRVGRSGHALQVIEARPCI